VDSAPRRRYAKLLGEIVPELSEYEQRVTSSFWIAGRNHQTTRKTRCIFVSVHAMLDYMGQSNKAIDPEPVSTPRTKTR